ncbi:hypothetical protein CBM2626_A40182 [Cupriavidus taiwanensis]|uniref:Uncharacterized protein n=1 Tax=Cupriavidus taiwanensis TaxID=164546 RepID=A0A976AYD3_9BURK|nr:hypothetical protein CBM2604_A40093 [Cupriavidus taiwanensis]SOZ45652.1 hypothetical protein CBM2610_A60093 [Cupriavidus taiwanensis]SOZ60315.1 hypothetical protein CBM2614_A60165 [Cupriavidus taiwanensis]SOZ63943.1 hypothetical protein CBM2613_A50167 [Cupriavidus taiwanensis]SOZ99637.1 hypothetical protein CBM2626_A40182 [Cupriavidus taiwanensis]
MRDQTMGMALPGPGADFGQMVEYRMNGERQGRKKVGATAFK